MSAIRNRYVLSSGASSCEDACSNTPTRQAYPLNLNLCHTMFPTTTRHDSPHAKREPPPDPVMMLLSATNVHLASLPTLTVHEDLHTTSKRAISVVKITTKAVKVPVPVGNSVPPRSGPSAQTAAPQTAAPPTVPTPTSAPQTPAKHRPTPFGSGSDSEGDSDNDNTPKVPRPAGLTRKALERHHSWDMDQATTDSIRVRLPSQFSCRLLTLSTPGLRSQTCERATR